MAASIALSDEARARLRRYTNTGRGGDDRVFESCLLITPMLGCPNQTALDNTRLAGSGFKWNGSKAHAELVGATVMSSAQVDWGWEMYARGHPGGAVGCASSVECSPSSATESQLKAAQFEHLVLLTASQDALLDEGAHAYHDCLLVRSRPSKAQLVVDGDNYLQPQRQNPFPLFCTHRGELRRTAGGCDDGGTPGRRAPHPRRGFTRWRASLRHRCVGAAYCLSQQNFATVKAINETVGCIALHCIALLYVGMQVHVARVRARVLSPSSWPQSFQHNSVLARQTRGKARQMLTSQLRCLKLDRRSMTAHDVDAEKFADRFSVISFVQLQVAHVF